MPATTPVSTYLPSASVVVVAPVDNVTVAPCAAVVGCPSRSTSTTPLMVAGRIDNTMGDMRRSTVCPSATTTFSSVASAYQGCRATSRYVPEVTGASKLPSASATAAVSGEVDEGRKNCSDVPATAPPAPLVTRPRMKPLARSS